MKADLYKAWQDAKDRKPCDKCGGVAEVHHPSVYGQNICHVCYTKESVCTQMYPGDRGYPAFSRKPSVPAVILPISIRMQGSLRCVVCSSGLRDPLLLTTRFNLPPVCRNCDGPAWWGRMDDFREEGPETVIVEKEMR